VLLTLHGLQFVGADTALETVPLLSRLRTENKGCLFAYSVEVDEDEAKHNSGVKGAGASSEVAPHKRAVQEMLTAIEVAADFEDGLGTRDILNRKTWVAIKLVRTFVRLP
jgi:proline dehydrogenase